MGKQSVTAADIRVLLREKYSDHRQFAYAEEVGNATGLEQKRRLDAVVVNVYKSKGYSIEGIEIKVSRADLRRELEDPSKHNIFYDSLDYYSLATTDDVLTATRKDEIPPKWGIYAVYAGSDGKALALRTVRKPLSLHDEKAPAIDRPFFACLMRALCNQTPSAVAIEAARKEGEVLAEKRMKAELAYSGSNKETIERLREELAASEQLRCELQIWGGAKGIARGIEKYKALTTVDLKLLDMRLLALREEIGKVRESIPIALQAKD